MARLMFDPRLMDRLLRLGILAFTLAVLTACREEGTITVRRLTFQGVTAVDVSQLQGVLATKQSSRIPWGRK